MNWLVCGDGVTRCGEQLERGVVYANYIIRRKSWVSFWSFGWDDRIFAGLPPEGSKFRAPWRGENLSVLDTTFLTLPRCPRK